MHPWIARCLLLPAAAAALSGCLSARSYIDTALPPADKQSVAAVKDPQPVQFLYEFRTRGQANARATESTAPRVRADVELSGLFSAVSEAPVANQRRLTVVIDNVPITDENDAKMKGFGTGLTFGLVGTMVTDGYVCEATYTAPGAEPLKMQYRHALHTTIGNASGPPGLEGRPPRDASQALIDQLMWSALRDLSRSGRL